MKIQMSILFFSLFIYTSFVHGQKLHVTNEYILKKKGTKTIDTIGKFDNCSIYRFSYKENKDPLYYHVMCFTPKHTYLINETTSKIDTFDATTPIAQYSFYSMTSITKKGKINFISFEGLLMFDNTYPINQVYYPSSGYYALVLVDSIYYFKTFKNKNLELVDSNFWLKQYPYTAINEHSVILVNNNKMGSKNKKDLKTIVPFIYDEIKYSYFFENEKWHTNYIAKLGDKYGVMDSTGKLIQNYKYQYISPFQDNIGIAKTNDSCYYIDKNYSLIFNKKFNDCHPFYNDKWARVAFYDSTNKPNYLTTKYGLINKNGEIAIYPQYNDIEEILGGDTFLVRTGQKYKIVTLNNEEIIPEFNSIEKNILNTKKYVVVTRYFYETSLYSRDLRKVLCVVGEKKHIPKPEAKKIYNSGTMVEYYRTDKYLIITDSTYMGPNNACCWIAWQFFYPHEKNYNVRYFHFETATFTKKRPRRNRF